jgi:hypothetical protein
VIDIIMYVSDIECENVNWMQLAENVPMCKHC